MRVGIVVPAHDVAACIADTLTSVIAQSHQDWAIVVVDDGSTDATAAIAAGFAARDPRIALLRQDNAGVSAARNRGLDALLATHTPAGMPAGTPDAVLFLDADDWLALDALACLAAALAAAPGAVAACGAYAHMAADARPGDRPLAVTARPCGPGGPRGPSGGDVLARLLVRNLFANGGHLLIRADALRRAGPFRTDLRYGEDWEFFVRLALLGPVAVAPGPPVLHVRRRPGGATLSLATDAAAHRPCTEAIYANPDLAARLGPALPALRRAAEAEQDWIIGRELLRHGRRAAGLPALARAWRARPTLRRALLLAAAHALPLLPPRLHGPFRAYAMPGARQRLKPSTG